MKSFKGVVSASIAFDVYVQINDVIKEPNAPYLTKVQKCIKNVFCLNNDQNVIISKAEKDQICGKSFTAVPSHHLSSSTRRES